MIIPPEKGPKKVSKLKVVLYLMLVIGPLVYIIYLVIRDGWGILF